MKLGYDSMFSTNVSKRGEIWAIPHTSQTLPSYLLRFRKIRQDSLWRVVTKPQRPKYVGFKMQDPKNFAGMNILLIRTLLTFRTDSGLVHENAGFICIWDTHPSWTVHCLVCISFTDIVSTNYYPGDPQETLRDARGLQSRECSPVRGYGGVREACRYKV